MKATIIYYFLLKDFFKVKTKGNAPNRGGCKCAFTDYWEFCNLVYSFWKYIPKALIFFLSFKLINPHIKIYPKDMIRDLRLMLKDI